MSREYLKLYLKLYFNKSDMEGAHSIVSMESIQNPGQMFFPQPLFPPCFILNCRYLDRQQILQEPLRLVINL